MRKVPQMSTDKLSNKLKKLHALMGSDNAGERENARRLIVELLAKHKKTWNDLPELVSAGSSQGGQDDPDDEPSHSQGAGLQDTQSRWHHGRGVVPADRQRASVHVARRGR